MIAGNALPKKKKYLDSAKRLQSLVARYRDILDDNDNSDDGANVDNETPILVYLRVIAHNIRLT